jgi:hypothetical protein
LKDMLERGMSFAEVARFLRRDENEVREKAREMNIRQPGTRAEGFKFNCAAIPDLRKNQQHILR